MDAGLGEACDDGVDPLRLVAGEVVEGVGEVVGEGVATLVEEQPEQRLVGERRLVFARVELEAAGATVDLLIEVEEPTFDETGPIGTACAYRAGRRGSLAAREPAVLAVGLASAAVEPYTVVGIQPTVVNRTLIRAPLAALPGSESDR